MTRVDIHSSDPTWWLLFHWWFLLPENCRCFANPRPDTNTVSHVQQHTQPDCYRVKTWDLIICCVWTVHNGSLSSVCICLWSKDVGLLFSFGGPADNSLSLRALGVSSFSTWTSKCCAHTQRGVIFRGNLFFIPGLPPVEQTERPFSFCLSWGTWCGLMCLQLFSCLQKLLSNSKNVTYNVSYLFVINNKWLWKWQFG